MGQAYASIKHNRRRTALTMLGMAWGIATVVILLAYGAGFGRAITAIFSNFGMQMMGVFPGRRRCRQAGPRRACRCGSPSTTCSICRNRFRWSGTFRRKSSFQANVQHENRTQHFKVSGFTPAIVPVRALEVETGRFYNDADEMQRSRVAVLGSDAKDNSFPASPPWAKACASAASALRSIGVLDAQNAGRR